MNAKGRRRRRLEPKSKEFMKEVSDIVKNAENDEAALAFLQDTLDDDFPGMELGSMNLHEATKVLGGSEPEPIKTEKLNVVENLNKSLGDFIDKQESNHRKRQSSKKARRRRRRKRK